MPKSADIHYINIFKDLQLYNPYISSPYREKSYIAGPRTEDLEPPPYPASLIDLDIRPDQSLFSLINDFRKIAAFEQYFWVIIAFIGTTH